MPARYMLVCPKCGKGTRVAHKISRRQEDPRLQEVRRRNLRKEITYYDKNEEQVSLRKLLRL